MSPLETICMKCQILFYGKNKNYICWISPESGGKKVGYCHICQKLWTSPFYYQLLMCLTTAEWVANNIEPDIMPHSVASDQGLGCLLRAVCSGLSVWIPVLRVKSGTQKKHCLLVSNWQLCHICCNKAQTTAGWGLKDFKRQLFSPLGYWGPFSSVKIKGQKHLVIKLPINLASSIFNPCPVEPRYALPLQTV